MPLSYHSAWDICCPSEFFFRVILGVQFSVGAVATGFHSKNPGSPCWLPGSFDPPGCLLHLEVGTRFDDVRIQNLQMLIAQVFEPEPDPIVINLNWKR